jgi:hypothetical protein
MKIPDKVFAPITATKDCNVFNHSARTAEELG